MYGFDNKNMPEIDALAKHTTAETYYFGRTLMYTPGTSEDNVHDSLYCSSCNRWLILASFFHSEFTFQLWLLFATNQSYDHSPFCCPLIGSFLCFKFTFQLCLIFYTDHFHCRVLFLVLVQRNLICTTSFGFIFRVWIPFLIENCRVYYYLCARPIHSIALFLVPLLFVLTPFTNYLKNTPKYVRKVQYYGVWF